MVNKNRHKGQKLTVQNRKEIWEQWSTRKYTKTQLAKKWNVSRQTIGKVIARARIGIFAPLDSTNHRFKCIAYGMRHLAKVEKEIEEKRKKKAKRYNKSYPGEMMHLDTKKLPKLKGESKTSPKEYLFVAIDDFSRELYADILPDKSQYSSATFLDGVVDQCPYTIELVYTDNGKEYKGKEDHAFVETCRAYDIKQKFTRVKRPQTNGKAERVIRTLMDMWHKKTEFKNRKHRLKELKRFVNWYNTVKPHKGINNLTPEEKLLEYFYPEEL